MKKGEYILGITASMRRVVGVLVHDATEGPVIVRTFTRKRSGADLMAAGLPELEIDDLSGAAFEITDSGNDKALFLDSEFKDPDMKPGAMSSVEMAGPMQSAIPFELEILDIMSECEDAGYPNPRVAFSLGSDHLHAFPVDGSQASGDERKKARKKKKEGPSREDLVELLREEHTGKIDPSKVTFLPMHVAKPGDSTHLGVFSHTDDPVHASLKSIRERKRPFPYVSLLDTEFTLLYGLARAARRMGPGEGTEADSVAAPVATDSETTLLIRVGPDDTIVMFMMGDGLLHFESLRSITAFDPPETICSRVLLLQDELGTGDANRLILFSDDREESLMSSLEQFFPDTGITTLRSILPSISEERQTPLGKESVMAAAAALRLVKDPLYQDAFPVVDFLDPKLKGRTIQLPFSWPVAAMFVMLFCSTLFFVFRYFYQHQELEMARYQLQVYPDDVIESSVESLQFKIDSLQARSNGYVGALDLLDSLLVGSDKWSRALEKTATHTAQTEGIWIDGWREESGRLVMEGTATNRDQIVKFAAGIGGVIGQQSFSSIRDQLVYSFNISLPMENVLPEAALFLRENARHMSTALSEVPARPDSEGAPSTQPNS